MFFVIRLQLEISAPSEIVDPDPLMSTDLMDGRDAFLTLARDKHYEFSSLRRVKYSTMGMLYELHIQMKDSFVYTCHDCKATIETRFHCNTCEVRISVQSPTTRWSMSTTILSAVVSVVKDNSTLGSGHLGALGGTCLLEFLKPHLSSLDGRGISYIILCIVVLLPGMLGLEAWPRPRGRKTWPRPRPRGLWPRPRPRGSWPRPRGFWPRASRPLEASRNGTECDWK